MKFEPLALAIMISPVASEQIREQEIDMLFTFFRVNAEQILRWLPEIKKEMGDSIWTDMKMLTVFKNAFKMFPPF